MDPSGAAGGASALRLVARAAATRDHGARVPARAQTAADHSPYRRGRMVDGIDPPGDHPAVRRVCARPAVALAGAADSIRRLRFLAAGVVTGRRAAEGDRLLERGAGGGFTRSRPGQRQATAGAAELSRRDGDLLRPGAVAGPAEAVGAAGASHPLHDPRGQLCRLAAPLYGPGRHPRRNPDRRPHAERNGTPDRLLPQYGGVALAVHRAAELPLAAAASARPGPGRLRSSGPSLRTPRRRIGAGA